MKYEIEEVNIASIKAGDTIEHEGVMRTVCHYDIRDGGFMGRTIFGDCYALGTKPVKKVNITTAGKIMVRNSFEKYADQVKLESDIRELAVKTDAPNCYDRVFHFYDGSKITKTRDGFVAE